MLEFFETSSRNLLAAEAAAGVGHHVALSVVGTDRLLAAGYFRAKMAQENLIKSSPIPYTIVRATQFFEFVGSIAQAATDGQTVRVSSVPMQPIVSDDVAAVMAEVAVKEPLNGTIEVAGPEPIRLDELVRKFLSANRDARTVTMDAAAGYFGTPVNDQSLTPVITRASASRVSRTGSAATPKHALQRASTGPFCSNRADGASAGYAYYTRYREARVAFREDNAAPLEGGFKASTSSAASSAF